MIQSLHDIFVHCLPAFGGAYLRRIYTILDRAIGMGCPFTLSIAGPTGYGFALMGNWTQTTSAVGRVTRLVTSTYHLADNSPLVDPTKIDVPTLIMRGEYDGIAGIDDLLKFYAALPNPDKQFSVMAGISHASFQQKNYLMVYHILHAFFTQPEPVYRG